VKKYVVATELPSWFWGESHRYETDKGIISMVFPCFANFETYEIYCIKGELFRDVERYDTLEDAEKRIVELIGGDFKFGR
jgi:hypothetical protein